MVTRFSPVAMMDVLSNIHSVFSDRPAPEAKLWRFLTAEKLMALLELKYLHFTRLDQLDAHFLGAWPTTRIAQKVGGMPPLDLMKTKVAALSWLESEQESVSMWGRYAGTNCVAITANFGGIEALLRSSKLHEYCEVMSVARVRYENPAEPTPADAGSSVPHMLAPFMSKHISYADEREVRALIVSKDDYDIEADGLDIEIDLFNFIHNVVISPFCDQWFVSMLYGILSKYNIEKKLRHSSMTRMTGLKSEAFALAESA